MALAQWRTDAGAEVTHVLVALVVCLSMLAALVLVLRYLERREARQTAKLAESVETELRQLLKTADDRLSRLEMGKAFTRG